MDRIATLGRCVFCYPRGGDSSRSISTVEKWVQRVHQVFTCVDVLNLILDLLFCLRLIFDGVWVGQGITLLGGIALSLVAAHFGRRLVNSGAQRLDWTPYCQSRRQQQQQHNNDSSNLLFALAFTELSIFMFEDVTTILVFLETDPTGDDMGWLDRANLWTTFYSAVVATMLLLVTLLYSIRYCVGRVMAPGSTLCDLTTALVCRGTLAVLFVISFLIVLLVVIIAINLVFRFLFERDNIIAGNGLSFGASVFVMWLFGFYFLHKIVICRKKELCEDHEAGATAASDNEDSSDAHTDIDVETGELTQREDGTNTDSGGENGTEEAPAPDTKDHVETCSAGETHVATGSNLDTGDSEKGYGEAHDTGDGDSEGSASTKATATTPTEGDIEIGGKRQDDKAPAASTNDDDETTQSDVTARTTKEPEHGNDTICGEPHRDADIDESVSKKPVEAPDSEAGHQQEG